jgi:hypothetical protein
MHWCFAIGTANPAAEAAYAGLRWFVQATLVTRVALGAPGSVLVQDIGMGCLTTSE